MVYRLGTFFWDCVTKDLMFVCVCVGDQKSMVRISLEEHNNNNDRIGVEAIVVAAAVAVSRRPPKCSGFLFSNKVDRVT